MTNRKRGVCIKQGHILFLLAAVILLQASFAAAGVFIGSSTALGVMALDAAMTSTSFKDFNEQGNWGTVVWTAGGAIVGGASSYFADKNSRIITEKTETTRVGRWMSESEYNKMVDTGYVQKPYNADQSYVANPADINAFGKQAKAGTVYVEFDVPSSSIKQTKDVWAAIPGPNSMYSKLNMKRGLPPYEFPKAINIELVGRK